MQQISRLSNVLTRWQIEQHSFFSASMTIKDEWGNDTFKAVNQLISFGWNLLLNDPRTGQALGSIKQTVVLFGMPQFRIELGGEEYGTVRREFSLFSYAFSIQSRDGPIGVSGDWTAHSYEFTRGNNNEEVVAKVRKEWITLRDHYSVDILPGQNVLFILSCCVVIDKCVKASRRLSRFIK